MIISETGNLLEAKVDALVNTVNTVGVMGKGIALQFAKAYPAMRKAYEKACEAGEVRPGHMWLYDCGGLDGGPRWIINFPTKRHWRAGSRMEDIEAGLGDLLSVIHKTGIRSIAIPPLGCGNGGLDWAEVRPKIIATLDQSPACEVHLFEPAGTPISASFTTKTPRPKMTPGRAALIALVNRYLKGLLDPMVSLLEIQKLMYFLQVSGEPLGTLKFSKHLYGPYSKNLGFTLKQLDGHFISGYGAGEDKPDTIIELMPEAEATAEEYLAGHMETHDRLNRVAALIDGFENAHGMEVLATVHWVMKEHPECLESESATTKAVHNWSARKRDKFRPEHILAARKRLLNQGWVAAKK